MDVQTHPADDLHILLRHPGIVTALRTFFDAAFPPSATLATDVQTTCFVGAYEKNLIRPVFISHYQDLLTADDTKVALCVPFSHGVTLSLTNDATQICWINCAYKKHEGGYVLTHTNDADLLVQIAWGTETKPIHYLVKDQPAIKIALADFATSDLQPAIAQLVHGSLSLALRDA